MKTDDFQLRKYAIPRISDSISFLYIEKAVIEQEDSSICAIQGSVKTALPIASLSCIILGPGTSITHRAVEAMADTDCLLVWSGDHLRSFYASGRRGETSCQNLLRQAEYWADKEKHIGVVRKMYSMRFPSMPVDTMPLARMRGAEGKRMKAIYKDFASLYGIAWSGRSYDRSDWESQDEINKNISIANDVLYNICHSIILAMNFSPEIGFIHTGKMRSFVWDVADIYKHKITIPTAFRVTSENGTPADIRKEIRRQVWEQGLVKQIVHDLYSLFDMKQGERVTVTILPELWNGETSVMGGISYS